MKDYTTVNTPDMIFAEKYCVQSLAEGSDSGFLTLRFHDHIIRTC